MAKFIEAGAPGARLESFRRRDLIPRFFPAALALLLVGSSAIGSSALHAQTVPGAPDSGSSPATKESALRSAREAQRRFEIERIRVSPIARGGSGICDAIVGRMCITNPGRDDWYPVLEDRRIAEARGELLATLAAAAAAAPDDPWVLGQRVVYLGEAGRWEESEELARTACSSSEGDGWCRALQGLALHALGRFEEAEAVFRSALARMGAERAARWADPDWLLDASGRTWWKQTPAAERAARSALLWSLADPLLLVPGNDALTEFWSRRTMARAREDARNGYGMSWGGDLEEMIVRFGWELGWDREPERPFQAGAVEAVSHRNPENRPFIPPGDVLRNPAASLEGAWIQDERLARSAYGPSYASVVLPGAGQLSLFPRGDRFMIVGAHALPEDTTFHSKHYHPARSRALPPWQERPTEAGLFLIPVDGRAQRTLGMRSAGEDGGAILLEAPAGDWVASLEVFDPARRRAGRTRLGVRMAAVPADVITLSDLMLIDGALPDGSTLEEAARHARPRAVIASGERLAIAWELFGLGRRPESLSYRFSVEKAGGGLVRTAGRMLGLVRAPSNQRLEWQEVGPAETGPVLRTVEIELPEALPGRYLVRLEVEIPGRTPLVKTKTVEIRPGPR